MTPSMTQLLIVLIVVFVMAIPGLILLRFFWNVGTYFGSKSPKVDVSKYYTDSPDQKTYQGPIE